VSKEAALILKVILLSIATFSPLFSGAYFNSWTACKDRVLNVCM